MPYQRKADDKRIVDLNSVGLSLSDIGEILDVHHTTVSGRLKALGIAPADTRRSFTGDIFKNLTPGQQDWLISQLGPSHSIKDLVRSLLIKEFLAKSSATTGI